jgi:hypothetical protein
MLKATLVHTETNKWILTPWVIKNQQLLNLSQPRAIFLIDFLEVNNNKVKVFHLLKIREVKVVVIQDHS